MCKFIVLTEWQEWNSSADRLLTEMMHQRERCLPGKKPESRRWSKSQLDSGSHRNDSLQAFLQTTAGMHISTSVSKFVIRWPALTL